MYKYYYHNKERGEVTLFNIEGCENCGRVVREVNDIKSFPAELPKLRKLGLIPYPLLPPEQEYNEYMGICTCSKCDGSE